jgi:hypothetical protein
MPRSTRYPKIPSNTIAAAKATKYGAPAWK